MRFNNTHSRYNRICVVYIQHNAYMKTYNMIIVARSLLPVGLPDKQN